jgi:lipopolysaccharide transport system ATP-binding protein
VAGTLTPSGGRVTVSGRLAALLELGAGFNPEFTGRENVRMVGAILGLSPKELAPRMEEILDFAEIGEFVDQPVRMYSSGMQVRLAFAVNACVRPDVLIVDEALAVGDAPFQAKCFKYLRGLLADGTTILFVSHDMGAVKGFCQKALWLHKGKMRDCGRTAEVTEAYEFFCMRELGAAFPDDSPVQQVDVSDFSARIPEGPPIIKILADGSQEFFSRAQSGRKGTGDIQLLNILATDENDAPKTTFAYGGKVKLHFLLKTYIAMDERVTLFVGFANRIGQSVLGVFNKEKRKMNADQMYYCSFTFDQYMKYDSYLAFCSISRSKEDDIEYNITNDLQKNIACDVTHNALQINIMVSAEDFNFPVAVHCDAAMLNIGW